jgi:hypothetical protein
MTKLKRKALLKELRQAKPTDSILELGAKAGYTKKSRSVYKNPTKTFINDYLDKSNPKPEEILNHYLELEKIAMNIADYTLAKGILDSLARIKAMFTDKQKVELNDVTPKEQAILNKYISPNRIEGLLPENKT